MGGGRGGHISYAHLSAAPMSSAKRRLEMRRPPMEVVLWCSCRVSLMMFSRKMLNRIGESRQPCRTPTVVGKCSPISSLRRTALPELL